MRGKTWIATSSHKGHPGHHPSLASLLLPQSLQGTPVAEKRETLFPVTALPQLTGQHQEEREGHLAKGPTVSAAH